ncbi:MAG TPA: alpha-glucan family phosphorylase [Dissulfurispiraceae bacterium]|nr:alpha-glucan family phosphorylase [Dissulfurispiraceae bacterium]
MDGVKILPGDLPERIGGLAQLSCNLWWSWHPGARMLFKMLNRVAWKESGHNPVKMLRELPKETFDAAAADSRYLGLYDAVMLDFQSRMEAESCWFTGNVTGASCLPIAYFSAEYGLHHSLPFYAGGLGFLAGDHLKECSDLGVPVVAIGFMYPEGYLRQRIREDGWQEGVDEILDRDSAPIERVFDDNEQQIVVKVPFIDPPVYVAVWKVLAGRVPIYLMDTDIDLNDPWHRTISAHLYAGDLELRLRQEIVLGIGGSEVLNTLGIRHSALHLNEGNPAFAILERVRERVADGASLDEAMTKVRNTTIFTTHTPVPAGHDVFPFELMDKYFGSYYPLLGLNRDAFLKLGVHPETASAGFNMTAFALRMSCCCNGVSKRHGEVARGMWQSLWPDKKEEEVPIFSITNGIHVPTWIEPKMDLLFDKYIGQQWLDDHDNPDIWKLIFDIPDRELWETHYWHKIKLINFIRHRVRQRWAEDHVSPTNIVAGGTLLDPTALTIGFARRFATYKRADLLFRDPDRLKALLNNRWKPVQIIFAGKAHPADDPGKRMLQKVFKAACDPEMGGRIAFIENYDEQLAQYMTHGVDVWLNNPLPPMEASGTSGMKASLNGVPNLSILDGWWIEGFNGRNGWAFGGDVPPAANRDDVDAESIYSLLEKEIVPLFYELDDDGISRGWIKVMKEAIVSNAPAFSARRMVKEYVKNFYQKTLASAMRDG